MLSLLAVLLTSTTARADERGADPPEPALTSPASPPAPPPCRPGVACSPGQVVQAELVALSPADAREALLAVRLLDETELDLSAARDREAQLRASLAACEGRDECPPVATPEGWGERWLGRAGWLLSGVAVGMGVGLGMAVWAGR
jgi:hypothetical protein